MCGYNGRKYHMIYCSFFLYLFSLQECYVAQKKWRRNILLFGTQCLRPPSPIPCPSLSPSFSPFLSVFPSSQQTNSKGTEIIISIRPYLTAVEKIFSFDTGGSLPLPFSFPFPSFSSKHYCTKNNIIITIIYIYTASKIRGRVATEPVLKELGGKERKERERGREVINGYEEEDLEEEGKGERREEENEEESCESDPMDTQQTPPGSEGERETSPTTQAQQQQEPDQDQQQPQQQQQQQQLQQGEQQQKQHSLNNNNNSYYSNNKNNHNCAV